MEIVFVLLLIVLLLVVTQLANNMKGNTDLIKENQRLRKICVRKTNEIIALERRMCAMRERIFRRSKERNK